MTSLKTVVALVLDETGSMQPTASDTRGSVNTYFEQLAKDAPDARVSVMKFSSLHADGTFRPLVTDVQPKDVPALDEENYAPNGGTPLYDAIGKAIRETESVEADRYLLVVMTDGEENSSAEWTLDGVRKLIEEKQASGTWTIIYLGANQDAWAVGRSMGVSAGNTMAYAQTPTGVHRTSSSLSVATASLLRSGAATTDSAFADAGQTAADYEDLGESTMWPTGEAGK